VIEPIGADRDDGDGPASACEPAWGGPGARRFLDLLQRRPLVLDAAMGTRLIASGLDLRSDDPALWNLTHPETVQEMHRRDLCSGAGAIVTNTFGANRFWLEKYGRSGAVASINRRAVQLAREAAGADRFVLGGLGPTVARHAGAAAEQAGILVEAGVDALIFETFGWVEIEAVLREVTARLAAPFPLVVSLWQWPEPPEPAARRLLERGASVIGVNCQPGIEAALTFAARMDRVVSCPLLVKPSVGKGKGAEMTPAALAAAVPTLLAGNVRLLGGCCGTTELHVKALADACACFEFEIGELRIDGCAGTRKIE
jgi:methionine synthase I (cobalamin-dependent)